MLVAYEDSIRQGILIKSNNTGFTQSAVGFKFSNKEETEKNEIILQNYEKMLIQMNPNIDSILRRKTPSNEPNLKEAICIANIVKISHSFLGKTSQRLLNLCRNCEFIASNLGITEKEEWFKEFMDIYKEIKNTFEILEPIQKEMRNNMRKKYREKFEELENKFNRKKSNKVFIDFILDNYKYKGQENDQELNKKRSSKDEQELIHYLRSKYHPDKYKYSMEDEKSQLTFCLIELIESFLNSMYEDIQ